MSRYDEYKELNDEYLDRVRNDPDMKVDFDEYLQYTIRKYYIEGYNDCKEGL